MRSTVLRQPSHPRPQTGLLWQAQQAKELSTKLTPAQLELLHRANEQPHPWASEWKGGKKKVLTKCIELHLVVVIDDRVRPSSLGLDILEILAAKEAP